MKRSPWLWCLMVWLTFGFGGRAFAAHSPSPSPSLDGFEAAISRWRATHGEHDLRYSPAQVASIADNILLMQRFGGGWPTNRDPTRILSSWEKMGLRVQKFLPGGSFDNHNVIPQLNYLAAAFRLTSKARYRDAVLRGLDFVLNHQMSRCGGWPHTIPAWLEYHGHLTLADGVTLDALILLRQVAQAGPPFDFIDSGRRARAAWAVEQGTLCLLRLQVRRNGQRTGWAAQYHPEHLTPARARPFEPPALSSRETVEALRFLMAVDKPDSEIVLAVESGVAWLRRVALQGLRLETYPAPPTRYPHHSSSEDRRLVPETGALPLWARFYDLTDDSVVLATAQGERAEDFSRLSRERRTGYDWFGDWPGALLADEYPAWRKERRPGDSITE